MIVGTCVDIAIRFVINKKELQKIFGQIQMNFHFFQLKCHASSQTTPGKTFSCGIHRIFISNAKIMFFPNFSEWPSVITVKTNLHKL